MKCECIIVCICCCPTYDTAVRGTCTAVLLLHTRVVKLAHTPIRPYANNGYIKLEDESNVQYNVQSYFVTNETEKRAYAAY